jgi:hypothetical protein
VLPASSLDFLQGTFEKIHFHGLFGQQALQLLDFFSIRSRVRTKPGRFFSGIDCFELRAPPVKAPSPYTQFAR